MCGLYYVLSGYRDRFFAVVCVYIPPSVNIEIVNGFCNYFCYCYDKLKSESPSAAIIAASDFNPDSKGLNITTIRRQCHIKQIVKIPTWGNANLIITDIYTWAYGLTILWGLTRICPTRTNCARTSRGIQGQASPENFEK